ncbi:hypothetical protein FS837_008811 [Tulasnella sp. UAMH 9824]|nr:hypothetical protein FS837_008811 [Tulasnella sp. UAMH 9824]
MPPASLSLQKTSNQRLRSSSLERLLSSGGSSPTEVSETSTGHWDSSNLPPLTIGESWLSRPDLKAELRQRISGANELSILLSDDRLEILFGHREDSKSGTRLPFLFAPMFYPRDATQGAAFISKVMNACGPVIKELIFDVSVEIMTTPTKQLAGGQEETTQQRIRTYWLWNVAVDTPKAKIIDFSCHDEATWQNFILFLSSRIGGASNGSSCPWPDMQALRFSAGGPNLARYGQRALASHLAQIKETSSTMAPALSRLRVPGAFYQAAGQPDPETQRIMDHVEPRAEKDDAIDTSLMGSGKRSIPSNLIARTPLSFEDKVLQTLQSPMFSSSPGSNPQKSRSKTAAHAQSPGIPQWPQGNDWLHHPNLDAELRRRISETNYLTVTLSDNNLAILFGYIRPGYGGKQIVASFYPMWAINDAAEGAAIIPEVMKVAGPILEELQVELSIFAPDVNATNSKQIIGDQEEPGEQLRHQWLRDVARITRKTKTITFLCKDKASWHDFVRFVTSRNGASDGSDYPWPDLQILQLRSTPDLLRYAQETLVTYLAETANHSGEDAPALSRLNVPGSFYDTAEADNPELAGLILEKLKPRAEDAAKINSLIWTRRED